MSKDKIFVGRKAELEQFKKILENPQGQAVLVVGNRGMGKTWLVNEAVRKAENSPDLKCFSLRYEVTPTDPANSIMAQIMNDAADAIKSVRTTAKKFVERNKKKLAALFGVGGLIPIVGSRVKAVGDLVISLTERDKAGNVRNQIIEVLKRLSDSLPDEGRAIFIIDPEKYMQEKSASAWRIVVKDLPHKIKLVFAQRTEDELAKSRTFRALDNVVRIPARRLGALKQPDVEELVELRAKSVRKSQRVLCESVEQYKGHPYAIQAALDIIKKTRSVENLPKDPTPDQFAEAQWDEVCEVSNDAVKLLEAYAILQVGVPDDVVQAVSGLETTTRKRLQKRSYLKGLLREEGYGKRIYHAILADYILEQIGKAEKKKYNRRAVQVYREKLKEAVEKQTAPDALAATRLAEHVLAAEGEKAFVYAFVNECTPPFLNLGLLDDAIGLSDRALQVSKKVSVEEAMVLGNLGLIYRTRGNLDKAEQMHRKSLEIAQELNLQEVIANQYSSLGSISETRGDFRNAEEMHRKALETDTELGRTEGIAVDYNNLGLVYRKQENFDKAEQMYLKALEANKKIERLGGAANNYGNLGLVYLNRGDLDAAERMLKESLEINKKLGRLEGMANQYGNLGLIYRRRGDLDKSEEMYHKVLEIEDKLGRMESVANAYINLGGIYGQRGDVEKAREFLEKALELYKQIGMPHMVEKVQGWIDELNKGSDS